MLEFAGLKSALSRGSTATQFYVVASSQPQQMHILITHWRSPFSIIKTGYQQRYVGASCIRIYHLFDANTASVNWTHFEHRVYPSCLKMHSDWPAQESNTLPRTHAHTHTHTHDGSVFKWHHISEGRRHQTAEVETAISWRRLGSKRKAVKKKRPGFNW